MRLNEKKIIMLGTSFGTRAKGGIATVLDTYSESGLFTRWPILYLTTHRNRSNVEKIQKLFMALMQFGLLLLRNHVALVHAHTASRASFWRKSIFFLLAFIFERPVILHLHGAQFHLFYEQELGLLGRKFVDYVLRKVSTIVVLSDQWKHFMMKMVSQSKIVVIPNPVLFRDMSRNRVGRSPSDEVVLLFLGRFVKRKGIYELLDSLKDVRSRCPNVRLLCAGDGDLNGVRTRVRALGLQDAVWVQGWTAGPHKLKLFEEADVYVLPSYNEGLPMSVLESMAAGLPVISTPVGGIPDAIVDGVEGLLVSPGDIPALSAAIEKLVGDPDLRNRMGSAAKRKAEAKFAAKRIIPQIEALYRSFGLIPYTGEGPVS